MIALCRLAEPIWGACTRDGNASLDPAKIKYNGAHLHRPGTSKSSVQLLFGQRRPQRNGPALIKGAAFFAYSNNYLIEVRFDVIVDVEASAPS
jgi:hypothetical protein